MKNHFHKKLVMTDKDNVRFKNSAKWWISENEYFDTEFKVRYHCHSTGKYRVSTRRGCNTNLKLDHKIPVVFYNLKHYDSRFIMQELGKFNPKLSVLPNGLDKYMSFTINNRLNFIDSFQFLSSSLDSLVKNVNKDDFKYLT